MRAGHNTITLGGVSVDVSPVEDRTGQPFAGAGRDAYPTSFGRAARLLRTARYIPPAQLAARLHVMAQRRRYSFMPERPIARARRDAAGTTAAAPLPELPHMLLAPEEMVTLDARAAELADGRFTYLGRTADFTGGLRWRDATASPLWLFNLHYLSALLDLTLSGRPAAARTLLCAWADAFGDRWDVVAWHPYPASLRLSNLCLAAGQAGGFDLLGSGAVDLAATHAAFLLRHLEHDLRGNHLLENAFALLCAARFLRGHVAHEADAVARRLFAVEIPEQVLPDGGHFELSPMYHSIVLHRLLQARWLLGEGDPLVRDVVAPAVARMAVFLRDILCPDGDIPLLGDSVRGVARPPSRLLDLAGPVGPVAGAPTPGRRSFMNTGLHVLRSQRIWAIFDAGPICPDYLPGHGQADSLTVEVWSDAACVVGDPGVHEYTGPERAWGRSSRAHSTLTVDDADTSEVYASFRVGGRARIVAVAADGNTVTATLEPFGVRGCLTRTLRLNGTTPEALDILDSATVPPGRTVRARLHLHPGVTLRDGPDASGRTIIARSPTGLVRIEAQHRLHLEHGRASRQYGLIEPTTILVQTLAAPGPSASVVAGKFSIQPLDHVA